MSCSLSRTYRSRATTGHANRLTRYLAPAGASPSSRSAIPRTPVSLPPACTSCEYRAPREASGVVGYLLEYAWSLAAWLVLAARQYARDPFGAIQIGQPPDVSPVLALPFRLLGVRYVADQRDLSPELFAARFGARTGPLPGILRILERTSWRLADRVLCVNESLRDAIIGRGGVDPAKVTIVANGPVLARVAEARPDPLLREGARHLVCWVGVMGAQDRLDLSLRAAADVVHRIGRRDVRFAFIGDGESLVMRRRSRVGSGSRGGSRSPVGSTKGDASPTSQRRTSGSTPTSKRRCPR